MGKSLGGETAVLEAGGKLDHGDNGTGGIEAKKARRLRFMICLYNLVEGLGAQPVRMDSLAARLGPASSGSKDHQEVVKQVRYLHGEELVTVSGPLDSVQSVALTHRGVREVERAMGDPDLPTEHFPPLNNVVADAGGGLGQQKGSAGANSLAVLSEQERLEVVRLVKSLRDWTDQLSLNDVQKAEYEADISTIEAQMDSSRPKTNLIEAILGSIKHTVEEAQHPSGSVADIVSAGIVSTIDRFVARF